MEALDELEQFKAQLVQVESLLSLDPSEQLETLKKDLEEAIAIMVTQRSESSVMSNEEIELDSGSESNEPTNESDQRNEQHQLAEYSQLIGEVYRVPFVNSDEIEMHEAEITKVLHIDEEDGDAKLEVRFLYPLSESMRHCANCGEEGDSPPPACPLSHGYTVHLSMIKNALDSNDLKLDSPCLYNKNGSELWSRGTIIDRRPDSFLVRPDASEESISVSLEQIRPFDPHALDDDDLELIEEDEVIFVGHKKVTLIELSDDEDDNLQGQSGDFAKLGAWEAQPSGFGSKILKKLGYVAGKGLGKNQQGIVDPVQLSILPSNTSLDACMELKKKGLLSNSLESFSHEKQKTYFKKLLLKRNLKNLKNAKSLKRGDEDRSGLFKTLNQNLATQSRPKEPTSVYSKLKTIQQETRNVDNVHLTIFQMEREIMRVKGDILHVKKSISLCKEINPPNLKRLKEKLTNKESELRTNQLRLRALKEKQKRNKYDHNVKYF